MDSGQDLILIMGEERIMLKQTVSAMKDIGRSLAKAERDYRIAYRQEVFRLHEEDGAAWTAATEMAKGEPVVAELRFKRDVLQSDYSVCEEKIAQVKLEIRILESEIQREWGKV